VARQDRGYFRKYYGDKDIYDIESWPGFEKLSYLTPDFITDGPFHQLKANKKAFQLQLLPHRKHRSFEQATVLLWTALCCSPLSWGKDMERHLILPSRDAIERMDANGNRYHHIIWPCGIGPILKRKPAGEISRSDIFAAVMKSAVSKQQQQLYSYNVSSM